MQVTLTACIHLFLRIDSIVEIHINEFNLFIVNMQHVRIWVWLFCQMLHLFIVLSARLPLSRMAANVKEPLFRLLDYCFVAFPLCHYVSIISLTPILFLRPPALVTRFSSKRGFCISWPRSCFICYPLWLPGRKVKNRLLKRQSLRLRPAQQEQIQRHRQPERIQLLELPGQIRQIEQPGQIQPVGQPGRIQPAGQPGRTQQPDQPGQIQQLQELVNHPQMLVMGKAKLEKDHKLKARKRPT